MLYSLARGLYKRIAGNNEENNFLDIHIGYFPYIMSTHNFRIPKEYFLQKSQGRFYPFYGADNLRRHTKKSNNKYLKRKS